VNACGLTQKAWKGGQAGGGEEGGSKKKTVVIEISNNGRKEGKKREIQLEKNSSVTLRGKEKKEA